MEEPQDMKGIHSGGAFISQNVCIMGQHLPYNGVVLQNAFGEDRCQAALWIFFLS